MVIKRYKLRIAGELRGWEGALLKMEASVTANNKAQIQKLIDEDLKNENGKFFKVLSWTSRIDWNGTFKLWKEIIKDKIRRK